MSLILDGTNGLSDVDGTAATPAIRGTDANTGIFFPAADTIAFSEGGTESMRLDSAGNLGIGTNSPTQKLDVAGTTQVRHLYTGASLGILFGQYNSSGDASINNQANAIINFATNNTERMRIDSSGNLLVGTTSSPSGGSRFNQSVNNYYGLSVENPSSTGGYGLLVTNNSSAQIAIFRSSGNNRLFIEGTGTLLNSTGVYGSFSDQKLKENIVDASPKLDKLMNLKVRNYNIIGEELKQIGFVAQELEQVFPSMVEENIDKDEENNDLGTSTKFVKNSVLIPILVKAMQEQQVMIQELKATVDAQAARIAALESAKA
jgi:hypothetical protein